MDTPNLGQLIADAFERSLRETPDAFGGDCLYEMLGGSRLTYREHLDRQPRNCYGDLIPRIVTVRRNLWKLKNGL